MHRQMLVVDCSCHNCQAFTYPVSGHPTYIVTSLGLPQADVLARQPHNVALLVHDARPSRAGADIDADIVVLVDHDLVVRIDRHLPGLLPRRVAEGHVVWMAGHDGRLFDAPLIKVRYVHPCVGRLVRFRLCSCELGTGFV